MSYSFKNYLYEFNIKNIVSNCNVVINQCELLTNKKR